MRVKNLFFTILIFSSFHLHGYESEEKLQAILLGKISNFITWQERANSNEFVITIYKNPYGKLFENLYANSKVQNKKVRIEYISSLSDLSYTNLLFIPQINSSELESIFETIKNKNILTVSDIRGFAEKNGMIQIYFASQKPKLKINLRRVKEENIQIRSSLLNIADVIKD
jgi:hypothetical protein